MTKCKVLFNSGKLPRGTDPLDLCNIRYAVDNALYMIDGVQWFISTIIGERDRHGGVDNVRFEIKVQVAYSPTAKTTCDFLYNLLTDAGLEVDEMSYTKKDRTQDTKLEYAFKDHSNAVIATAIADSARAWVSRVNEGSQADDIGDLDLCLTSIRCVKGLLFFSWFDLTDEIHLTLQISNEN